MQQILGQPSLIVSRHPSSALSIGEPAEEKTEGRTGINKDIKNLMFIIEA